GVTFGRVPVSALAALVQVKDGAEVAIGPETARAIFDHLTSTGMIDKSGRIMAAFKPDAREFSLEMPAGREDLADATTDLLSRYRLERHVRRARDERPNKLKKEVVLDSRFQELWARIC